MNVNKVIFSVFSIAARCIAVIVIVFLMFNGSKKAYLFGRAVAMDEPVTSGENAREITVTIPKEASAREIGEILERKNLIKDSNVFYVQSFLVEEGKTLKGGQYDLNTSMSAKEMMEIIGAKKKKNGEE